MTDKQTARWTDKNNQRRLTNKQTERRTYSWEKVCQIKYYSLITKTKEVKNWVG